MIDPDEQLRRLVHGAKEVHTRDELERRIRQVTAAERPPLRVKLGIDPTTADLHLGHTVVLRKLRDFQRLGHTAVLVVGGFTAQVGDPSGRSTTRPVLGADTVAEYAQTYVAQVRKVLLPERLEVVDNRDWLTCMDLREVLRLTAGVTVAQMLERADFRQRHTAGSPIALSEFLYPLLQAQDSVAVRADVELGGTDQTFNLLVGRGLQQAAGQPPQCVLTMPLIEGLDGSVKMSKTAGNAIGVTDDPSDMFGKVMRLPDQLMLKYFRLVTDVPPDELDQIAAGLADTSLHPAAVKRRLGREIVSLYHSANAAAAAEKRFDLQFRQRGVPDDVPVVEIGHSDRWFLPKLLQQAGLVGSGSEGRRMVRQAAVCLDGELLRDETAKLATDALDGRVLQVGRRRFARLVARRTTDA